MTKLPHDQAKLLRTLIVDDDNFSLRIIRHILYSLGINRIEEAFNGEEAVKLLNAQAFDLLITDVEMPKMNGLELIKTVRGGKTTAPRTLATIVITNFSETKLLGPILALDVNGFLTKPIKQSWVNEKIIKAINEGGYIQPASHYEAVDTHLGGLRQKQQTPQSKAATAEEGLAKNGEVQVFVRNLKSGMRLQRDIRLKDGTLLLKPGYRVTESTINRLLDLKESLASESVFVQADSIASADPPS